MPAPDIGLSQGMVLVTQAASTLGVMPLDNNYLFGVVAKVYSTSGYLADGQSVMFNASKAVRIIYGTTVYYQVHEEFVTGNEVISP